MKKQFELIATAAAGLEAVVGREIRNLGYECQVENGRGLRINWWLHYAKKRKLLSKQIWY
ncbi:TPA: hypothetical protein U0727_001021 [Streptococcus suis]|nr:hypothetical protein [Streptococcus suis]HEM3802341.1 hypothetical protein [Streptococcus suis]HEM3810402.1 hypothetical protein [Streptococcus suis]